jgi:hypothetical protein
MIVCMFVEKQDSHTGLYLEDVPEISAAYRAVTIAKGDHHIISIICREALMAAIYLKGSKPQAWEVPRNIGGAVLESLKALANSSEDSWWQAQSRYMFENCLR